MYVCSNCNACPPTRTYLHIYNPLWTQDDSITGAVTGVGRRSRKRNMTAAETTGVPSTKAVALPGRRGRNDEEEEEGFGVAMSQQVRIIATARVHRLMRCG